MSKTPNQMVRQTMFSTGQVDEQVWKRTDAEKLYLTAAQKLVNCEVGTTGLAKKRKGTVFALDASAYATPQSKCYEFVDKNGNYYLIMSAAGHFYVFDSATEGRYVVDINGNYVVDINGDYVVAFDDAMSLVQDLITPYDLQQIGNIDYSQDDDNLILAHPDFPTGRIYISDYATDPPTFAYQVLDINPIPTYDFGDINYASYSAVFTNPTATTFRLVLTGADASSFTNAWIGGQVVALGTSTINALGYGNITSVTILAGPTRVQFDGTVVEPFADPATMPTVGSQYIVRQPAWSADLGYPSKVLYFQNRLWLANTARLSNTIFGSRINQPAVFDVGTGRDTDAIVYTIGISNSGAINWLNGGKQLEIYCQNIECACPQDQNLGLTPSTFSVRQQSAYGSSTILKPVTYLNDSYFVSKTGQAIINFHFTGVGLAYEAKSKSPQSQSLVKSPSNRALLRGDDINQDNFIYFLNPSDETLTTFQFANETDLAALTPIETSQVDEDGNPTVDFIDIVTINNQVCMLKYYELSDTYTVEKMVTDVKVDSYSESFMPTTGIITGLDRFEGYTVQVVFENQDFGTYLVSGGTITVDNPNQESGTAIIGLLYDVLIRPMYIYSGSNQAPFMKQMSAIYVDYYNSLDIYINGLLEPYQTFAEIQAGVELVPKTGTAIIYPVSGYDRFSTFDITQSSPFDMQILSIGYQLQSAVI